MVSRWINFISNKKSKTKGLKQFSRVQKMATPSLCIGNHWNKEKIMKYVQ